MKPKILIVDDEPLNLATLEAFLAGDAYDLHFAENGPDALALARLHQPDLILLDVMMPEMDGFTVCRTIRRDAIIGRIPILLITALDDSASRLEGLDAGADDFLTKPCRREEIRARVRTVASLNRFRSIAEQRARFEHLYELAPGAIVLTDIDGRVVAANARAEGHRVGEPIFGQFHPDSTPVLRSIIVDAMLDNSASAAREVRAGTGEQERVFNVRAAFVPEGASRLVMLVFDDVTAEVQARRKLETMNEELERQVRARTRELEESNGLLMSYANFVSHDLRSPLTVIKGYLSLIQEGVVPLNADAAPLIDRAFQSTLTMQELIQNILQLAQDEHDGQRGEASICVDATPVISRLWMRVRELFPAVTPRFDLAPLPEVGVSAVVIERIFYNLLSNALKYSSAQAEPVVTVGATQSPEGPVLFVRDNGVGFDARDSDKLFREFSRLSTAGTTEGFGLGLSLVARLVRAHGGRIWAESTVGAGATFFVQLPAPRAAGAESPATPELQPLAATG